MSLVQLQKSVKVKGAFECLFVGVGVCAGMCVCVCVSERERERERESNFKIPSFHLAGVTNSILLRKIPFFSDFSQKQFSPFFLSSRPNKSIQYLLSRR